MEIPVPVLPDGTWYQVPHTGIPYQLPDRYQVPGTTCQDEVHAAGGLCRSCHRHDPF